MRWQLGARAAPAGGDTDEPVASAASPLADEVTPPLRPQPDEPRDVRLEAEPITAEAFALDDDAAVASTADAEGGGPSAPEESEAGPAGERTDVQMGTRSVFFAVGSSALKRRARVVLDELASLLRTREDLRLVIEGHADGAGRVRGNLVLSAQRTKAVHDYLLSQGVAAERIEGASRGAGAPRVVETSGRALALNRRVQLLLVSVAPSAAPPAPRAALDTER
jgi:outer membrane protein OmpA-like peptidoglycan-associated protein